MPANPLKCFSNGVDGMTDSFDPYYKWLGIPPAEQPATYYRLLAITPFETDTEVIDNAANRQMMMVRTFQSGQRSKLSQRLLNEISAARITLLDPEKRAKYDQQLKQRIAAATPQPDPLSAPQLTPLQPLPQQPSPVAHGAKPSLSAKLGLEPWVLTALSGAGAVALLVLVILSGLFLFQADEGELIALELAPAATGSRVIVDGKEVSMASRHAELRLPAGVHKLTVQRGAESLTRDFTVKSGVNPPVRIEALKPVAAVTEPTGTTPQPAAIADSPAQRQPRPATGDTAGSTPAPPRQLPPAAGSGDDSPRLSPPAPITNTLPGKDKYGSLAPSGGVVLRMGEPWLDRKTETYRLRQSPDGTKLLTSNNSVLRLWSYPGGKQLLEVPVKGDASRADFVKNGKAVILSERYGQLSWVDTETGVVTPGHKIPFYLDDVVDMPDGRVMGVCRSGKQVHVVNLESGESLISIDLKTPLNRFTNKWPLLVDDGKYLSFFRDNVLEIWDLATMTERRLDLSGYSEVKSQVRGDRGSRIVLKCTKEVVVIDCKTGEEIARRKSGLTTDNAAISPDGRIVAVSDTSRIHFWVIATGQELPAIRTNFQARVMRFSTDGNHLFARRLPNLKLYDVRTSEEVATTTPHPHTGKLEALKYSPDGKMIAAANELGSIRLWDAATGDYLRDVDPDRKTPGRYAQYLSGSFMEFVPQTGALVSASTRWRTGIHFWDPQTGHRNEQIKPPAEVVKSVAISDDGQTLVATKYFGGLLGYNLKTRQKLKMPDMKKTAYSLDISPDGKTLAYSDKKAVIFWSLDEQREIDRVSIPDGGISSLRFMSDSRHVLVTTYRGKTGELTKTESDNRHFTARVHVGRSLSYATRGGVYAVARPPAHSTYETVVEVWDEKATGPKSLIRTRTNQALAIALSPDGKHLASTGGFGAITVRKLP